MRNDILKTKNWVKTGRLVVLAGVLWVFFVISAVNGSQSDGNSERSITGQESRQKGTKLTDDDRERKIKSETRKLQRHAKNAANAASPSA